MKTAFTLGCLMLLAGCQSTTSQQMRPTVIAYGDSHSLGYSAHARFVLYDTVDFRHDDWDREDIVPADNTYYYALQGKHGYNDGDSSQLLQRMETTLNDRNYTVVVFNAGNHDLKFKKTDPDQHHVPLDAYRNNIEAAAQMAESHAVYVIWVDTLPIPAGVLTGVEAGAEKPYNAVADKIAHQHGFYILHMQDAQHLPNDIHYTAQGYTDLGAQVADCVKAVLFQAETETCHK